MTTSDQLYDQIYDQLRKLGEKLPTKEKKNYKHPLFLLNENDLRKEVDTIYKDATERYVVNDLPEKDDFFLMYTSLIEDKPVKYDNEIKEMLFLEWAFFNQTLTIISATPQKKLEFLRNLLFIVFAKDFASFSSGFLENTIAKQKDIPIAYRECAKSLYNILVERETMQHMFSVERSITNGPSLIVPAIVTLQEMEVYGYTPARIQKLVEYDTDRQLNEAVDEQLEKRPNEQLPMNRAPMFVSKLSVLEKNAALFYDSITNKQNLPNKEQFIQVYVFLVKTKRAQDADKIGEMLILEWPFFSKLLVIHNATKEEQHQFLRNLLKIVFAKSLQYLPFLSNNAVKQNNTYLSNVYKECAKTIYNTLIKEPKFQGFIQPVTQTAAPFTVNTDGDSWNRLNAEQQAQLRYLLGLIELHDKVKRHLRLPLIKGKPGQLGMRFRHMKLERLTHRDLMDGLIETYNEIAEYFQGTDIPVARLNTQEKSDIMVLYYFLILVKNITGDHVIMTMLILEWPFFKRVFSFNTSIKHVQDEFLKDLLTIVFAKNIMQLTNIIPTTLTYWPLVEDPFIIYQECAFEIYNELLINSGFVVDRVTQTASPPGTLVTTKKHKELNEAESQELIYLVGLQELDDKVEKQLHKKLQLKQRFRHPALLNMENEKDKEIKYMYNEGMRIFKGPDLPTQVEFGAIYWYLVFTCNLSGEEMIRDMLFLEWSLFKKVFTLSTSFENEQNQFLKDLLTIFFANNVSDVSYLLEASRVDYAPFEHFLVIYQECCMEIYNALIHEPRFDAFVILTDTSSTKTSAPTYRTLRPRNEKTGKIERHDVHSTNFQQLRTRQEQREFDKKEEIRLLEIAEQRELELDKEIEQAERELQEEEEKIALILKERSILELREKRNQKINADFKDWETRYGLSQSRIAQQNERVRQEIEIEKQQFEAKKELLQRSKRYISNNHRFILIQEYKAKLQNAELLLKNTLPKIPEQQQRVASTKQRVEENSRQLNNVTDEQFQQKVNDLQTSGIILPETKNKITYRNLLELQKELNDNKRELLLTHLQELTDLRSKINLDKIYIGVTYTNLNVPLALIARINSNIETADLLETTISKERSEIDRNDNELKQLEEQLALERQLADEEESLRGLQANVNSSNRIIQNYDVELAREIELAEDKQTLEELESKIESNIHTIQNYKERLAQTILPDTQHALTQAISYLEKSNDTMEESFLHLQRKINQFKPSNFGNYRKEVLFLPVKQAEKELEEEQEQLKQKEQTYLKAVREPTTEEEAIKASNLRKRKLKTQGDILGLRYRTEPLTYNQKLVSVGRFALREREAKINEQIAKFANYQPSAPIPYVTAIYPALSTSPLEVKLRSPLNPSDNNDVVLYHFDKDEEAREKRLVYEFDQRNREILRLRRLDYEFNAERTNILIPHIRFQEIPRLYDSINRKYRDTQVKPSYEEFNRVYWAIIEHKYDGNSIIRDMIFLQWKFFNQVFTWKRSYFQVQQQFIHDLLALVFFEQPTMFLEDKTLMSFALPFLEPFLDEQQQLRIPQRVPSNVDLFYSKEYVLNVYRDSARLIYNELMKRDDLCVFNQLVKPLTIQELYINIHQEGVLVILDVLRKVTPSDFFNIPEQFQIIYETIFKDDTIEKPERKTKSINGLPLRLRLDLHSIFKRLEDVLPINTPTEQDKKTRRQALDFIDLKDQEQKIRPATILTRIYSFIKVLKYWCEPQNITEKFFDRAEYELSVYSIHNPSTKMVDTTSLRYSRPKSQKDLEINSVEHFLLY